MPDNLEQLLDDLRVLLDAIKGSLQEQIRAIRDTSETTNETWKKIPTYLSELCIPADERAKADAHRKKQHRQQIWLTWGTWLAFIAAGVYAGVATRQLRTMNKTYGEIEKQTKAAQNAAYAACLNAQVAQATFLQVKSSASDSHAATIATVEQAAVGIETERAIVSFSPRFPIPENLINNQLVIPFSLKNDGKSAALSVTVEFKAILLGEKDTLQITEKNFEGWKGKYFAAGDEFPGKASISEHKPMTAAVLVRDTKGAVVAVSSQGAKDFLSGGQEIVAVYGHLEYPDFSGIHKVRFCYPIFIVLAGTGHKISANEITCAKYNHQNDQYTAMPKINTPTPMSLDQIPPINCEKPRE